MAKKKKRPGNMQRNPNRDIQNKLLGDFISENFMSEYEFDDERFSGLTEAYFEAYKANNEAGMALAKQEIEAMGGWIRVKEDGTFSVMGPTLGGGF
jgi:hypothetical protein